MIYRRNAYMGPTPEQREQIRVRNFMNRVFRPFGPQNPIWKQKRKVLVEVGRLKRPVDPEVQPERMDA